MNFQHDIVIIGIGLTGLRAAIECVEKADVAVVSKVLPTRSHSGAAQGGITASIGNEEEDHWEWHMFDTVKGSDYLADQESGTIVTGLYAAGECACVSVHGANRLGCNSLLDTLVFGRRCGLAMKADIPEIDHDAVSDEPLKKTGEMVESLLNHKGREKIEDIRRNM